MKKSNRNNNQVDDEDLSFEEYLKIKKRKKGGTILLLIVLIVVIAVCAVGVILGSSGNNKNDSEENTSTEELISQSSYEWTAGELDYLKMDRSTILEIYKAYDNLYSNEAENYDNEEELNKFINKCYETIAQNYDMSTEDVENIWKYGSVVNYFATFDVNDVNSKNGEVVNVKTVGTNVYFEVKVDLLYTNSQTITQNYENVFYLIKNYAGVDFDSITYVGTADMDDGNEKTIISFDLNNLSVIDQIASGEMTDYTSLGNYTDNLYILQSLRED